VIIDQGPSSKEGCSTCQAIEQGKEERLLHAQITMFVQSQGSIDHVSDASITSPEIQDKNLES
jgi:hypothetical protein